MLETIRLNFAKVSSKPSIGGRGETSSCFGNLGFTRYLKLHTFINISVNIKLSVGLLRMIKVLILVGCPFASVLLCYLLNLHEL